MFRTTINPILRVSRPATSILPRRFISTEIKEALDGAVNSSPVVLFMKGTPEFPQCGFSRATIQILGQQGVDPSKFAAYNVLEDPELRDGIKEYSQWPTIPQLYVNKEFVGGCDIVTSMAKSGELAELLEANDCLVPVEEPQDSSANVKPAQRS
ncbi:monothiol glutaredoxin-5, mitochondrial [[Candida] railenensis]|uniref:Monothiol glutaredoxin-5, mitochondrial n=1 Tax=[Candida] railenensis TaxID=45579 RepID=A0A9P0W043_9ASCO|nr:monothiol glutaredoxin-5, mitochondrial [[Candida] railenensis]